MRKPAIGPPTRLATTSPSVAVATPTSSALCKPESLGDDRRPGDDGAVAADQRRRADERRHAGGQAKRRGAADGDEVLEDEIDDRQRQQDEERPPARDEVVELGVEADAGEEIEQQHVARREREADLDVEERHRRSASLPPRAARRSPPRECSSAAAARSTWLSPAPMKNTTIAMVELSSPGT